MAYIGVSPSNGVRRVHTYTATASQTTFSGAGAEGTSLSYKDSNFVDVYQNGIKLGDADYTSTSGTSIVLAQGASVDDLVVVVVFDVFSVADTVSKADGGTFDGNVTMAGTLGVTGATTLTGGVSGNTTFSGEIITSTSGTSNVRIGENAGDAIASGGNYNVCVGDEAGTAITTGDSNVAVGFEALKTNTTATGNNAIGSQSLKANTDGASNIAIGQQTMINNTTGSNNTAIGHVALGDNITGSNNVAVGDLALNANTASNNTAVGSVSLDANTTGTSNVALGRAALTTNTTGSNNVAVGVSALEAVSTNGSNVAVGNNSLVAALGTNNTAIGHNAGSAITSGVSNTIIGNYTGNQSNLDIRTTNQNIVLSDGAGNALYHIDSNAQHNPYRPSAGTNNNIVTFTSNVNGTRNGACNIQCDGDIFNLNGSYGQISDQSLKENIVDANSQWNDIKALQIRNFSWIVEGLDAPNKIGVIAQEVQTAGMNGLIKEQEDGTLAVKHSILYMKAVKALQEAMTRIETLETANTALEARITALENAE